MSDPLLNQMMGPYRIQRLLGVGGMGRVYLAHYKEHSVALKVVDLRRGDNQGLVKRLRQEIELAEHLRHPNIVRVYGGGRTGNYLFMAMEYVPGGSLKDYISRQGSRTLPVGESLRIARQICAALAYAHRQEVIHRDVKPANILMHSDGRALLSDFGVARALGQLSGEEQGRPVGTAAYISPEQAQGQPATAISDLYALGAVLYEMLTGEPPFHAETIEALLYKHVHDTPPRLQDRSGYIPSQVLPVVRRAMTKDPNRRFHKALDMDRALEQAMGQLSIPIPTPPSEERGSAVIAPPRWSEGRRTWGLRAIVAGGALLLVLVVALLILQPNFGSTTTPTPTITWTPPPTRIGPTMPHPTAVPSIQASPTTAPSRTPTIVITVPNAAQTLYAEQTQTAARPPTNPVVQPTRTPTLRNFPPSITGFSSTSGSLSVRARDDWLVLYCSAQDRNGDMLTFTWYVNDQQAKKESSYTSSQYTFEPEKFRLDGGQATIRIRVADRYNYVEDILMIKILPASP